MPIAVSPTVLLAGAWHAVAQAGCLLRDAAILYDQGSHSSATGLSLLGREELGRFSILRDLWRKASGGTVVSKTEVQRACEDHVDKQKRAQLSLTHRVRADTSLAKLFQSLLRVLPSSGAAHAIRQQIEQWDRVLAKRTPDDRHKLRMRALYIDVNDTGTDWTTPSSVTAEQAFAAVHDAVNDYAVLRDRLTTPGVLAERDPVLAAAFDALPNRPELPGPRWPQAD